MSGSGGPRGKHAGMSSVMRGKIPAAENPRFREPCWTIPCKTVLRTRAAGLDRWSADVGPVGGGGKPPPNRRTQRFGAGAAGRQGFEWEGQRRPPPRTHSISGA